MTFVCKKWLGIRANFCCMSNNTIIFIFNIKLLRPGSSHITLKTHVVVIPLLGRKSWWCKSKAVLLRIHVGVEMQVLVKVGGLLIRRPRVELMLLLWPASVTSALSRQHLRLADMV